MSRVGKLPIICPDQVKLIVEGLAVSVEGPQGKLEMKFKSGVRIDLHEKIVSVHPVDDTDHARAMWGTARSIINNMVKGVSVGFTTELEIFGVGYRAVLKDKYLNLSLGKSHSYKVLVPSDIKVQCPKLTEIILHSCDKEKLGEFVSSLIKLCPSEPYKGKGIRKKGQDIYRKEGKKSK